VRTLRVISAQWPATRPQFETTNGTQKLSATRTQGAGRGLAACDHTGLVDQIEEEPDHERDRGGAAQVLPAAHNGERRRALFKWFRDIRRAQSNTRINSAAPDQRVRAGLGSPR